MLSLGYSLKNGFKYLFHEHVKFPSLKALRVSVMRLTEEQNKLKMNEKPLDSFISTPYILPHANCGICPR